MFYSNLLKLQSCYMTREAGDNTRHFPGPTSRSTGPHGAAFHEAIVLLEPSNCTCTCEQLLGMVLSLPNQPGFGVDPT